MPDQHYNTGDGLMRVQDPEGVWIVYHQDWNPNPLAVFLDELSARRLAAERYAEVRFWRFGEDWYAAEEASRKETE